MANKPLSDAEIKAKLIAKAQVEQKKENLFPTEIVPLPSKGLVYPKEHPLSSGKVEMKYMTAKEEDILTNGNLLKTGRAIDALYKSLLVGNGEGQPVSLDDMTIGDKSALMIATRVLGYGPDYTCEVTDDNGEKFDHTFNLNELKLKEVDYSIFKNSRELEYTLPVSNVKVVFKLRTSKEEEKLSKDLIASSKSGRSSSVTTTLKHSIVSIDGDNDPKAINKFIDNHMIARDSLSLRLHMAEIAPDYDLTVFIDRPDKGVQKELQLPIDTTFFWPRS